jgi:small lipoprotein (TIGR04454 family)
MRANADENVDMRRMPIVLALVGTVAFGCGKKPKDEAPCGTVAGRLFTIARDELGKATADAATRRSVADQLPAMRDALTKACTDGKWSREARNCMANAPDHAAFQGCQQQLTDDQRRKLDEAARGETSSH